MFTDFGKKINLIRKPVKKVPQTSQHKFSINNKQKKIYRKSMDILSFR